MKAAAFLLLLLLVACGQQPSQDSARLDSLLSGLHVDHVDLVSLSSSGFKTNTLTEPEAAKFVLSLNKTNRIDSPDLTKDQVDFTAHLVSGTNGLCSIDCFENGLWRIGDYSFRIRSIP